MKPTDADLRRVREFLRRQRGAFLNPKDLCERVRDGARLSSVLLARMCLGRLRELGEISCDAWSARGPEARVHLHLAPAEISEGEAAWHAAVDAAVSSETDRAAYREFWQVLAGWPRDAYLDLIAEIETLRRAKPNGLAGYLFSASGRLASSKLLFGLPKQPLRALGIDLDALAPGPTYVIIAGPREVEAVVLVENPNAFERAVRATAGMPVAWVSAYGFGAAAIDGGARLLAGLSDLSQVVSVVRAGDPSPLPKLLANAHLLYWGDLDLAGLQIFYLVRRRLPGIRLSALMQPMIDLLHAGGGHPYAPLTGKPAQRDRRCDDRDLLRLVELCRRRAADQEHVSDAEIRKLALAPLSN